VTNKQFSNEPYMAGLKNLWNSIRSKVFTNYSAKGLRTLVEWLVERMSQLASSSQIESGNKSVGGNSDLAKLEISEEE